MKDLEAFATSELSEEGIIIPLTDVEGKQTKHWLKIKSTDSIAFKKAQSKFRTRILALHELEERNDGVDYTIEQEKLTTKLLASLVIDWSFKNDDGSDYECNESNIIKVLQDAPILAQEIDRASARRQNFIKRSLKKSKDLQSKSSSSTKSQKIAKSAS